MGSLKILLIIVFLVSAVGCNSELKKEDRNDQFKFIVLSDIHVKDSDGHLNRLKDFVNQFNSDDSISNDVNFVVTTGDNVSYVFSDREKNRDSVKNSKLKAFISTMSQLKVPYHVSMGNHEYKVDKNRDADGFFPESEILVIDEIWKKETGLNPYYSIKKGSFNFIILNSNRGRYQNKFIDNKQLVWLKSQLDTSKNVVLFFHHPLRTDNIQYWYKKKSGTITDSIEPEFFKLLSKNKIKIKAIFTGHGHKWIYDKLFGNIKVYQTTSFGDHEEFRYYTVEISKDDLKVSKSVDEPFFKGFEFENDKNEKQN